MATPIVQISSVLLGAILWLCPLWYGPTPTVPPLLWGGCCLGLTLWLIPRPSIQSDDRLLTLLLLSLGAVVAVRSSSLANALAANLCLFGIGLAAYWGRSIAQMPRGNGVQLAAGGLLLAGLINSGFALMQYFGWTSEPAGTAFGFLRQRNNMASLCALAWVALLYLTHVQKLAIGWAILGSVLLMTALAATASRTGVLQLLLLCVFIGLLGVVNGRWGFLKSRIMQLCVLSLTTFALAVWILPQTIGSGESLALRVLGTVSSAAEGVQLNDSRKQLWSNAWDIALVQPMLGVGWRELAYKLHMTDFGVSKRFEQQADHAHNLPLQFAAELGLVFTTLWLLCLAAYVCHKARIAWRARHAGSQATSLLGWGILLVLGIHSLLEYPLWYAPFQVALGLGLGLLTNSALPDRTLNSPRSSASRVFKVSWHKLPQLLGTIFVIFCTYAAFDYHRVSQLFLTADQRSSFYQTDTMTKAERSWLFANQVRFAKLFAAPVTAENAAPMWALGQQVIHFSPEPRVFKALIAAGEHLQTDDSDVAVKLVILKRQLTMIER